MRSFDIWSRWMPRLEVCMKNCGWLDRSGNKTDADHGFRTSVTHIWQKTVTWRREKEKQKPIRDKGPGESGSSPAVLTSVRDWPPQRRAPSRTHRIMEGPSHCLSLWEDLLCLFVWRLALPSTCPGSHYWSLNQKNGKYLYSWTQSNVSERTPLSVFDCQAKNSFCFPISVCGLLKWYLTSE